MSRKFMFLITFLIFSTISAPSSLRADSELEEKFQDMFVTAGYSAAAGAAIGAALLTFQETPLKKLKYISIGASIGFLGGTALGGWMALAPVFVENTRPEPSLLAGTSQTGQLVIRPWIDVKASTISGIEAGTVFAKF